jgi:deazaflavin-dependent oxidoreductase (nitroreductase family)
LKGSAIPIEKPPAGTRGAKPPPRLVAKLVMPLMQRIHRRSGDRFSGMDVLYLHTMGARSGQARTSTVARMDDGKGGILVVASAAGAQQHPAWYHNIAAHPDQVWIEFGGTKQHVSVRQLAGGERSYAWERITEQVPRFKGYRDKTDRLLPVLRLTPT